MTDGLLSTLGIFEGLSSILILCILVFWFIRQVIQAIREGRSGSVSLAESTIKLLTEEQDKTAKLNEAIDNLYAENRLIRAELHALKSRNIELESLYTQAKAKIEVLEHKIEIYGVE